MTMKAQAMVLASFVADSLALGAHWIYDTSQIDEKLGRVDTLLKPLKNSFHPTKDRGDFTHYGDQTIVLLESIAANKGFELDRFAQSWQRFMKGYNGYRDHATKDALNNFNAGKKPEESGSPSTDLGGAARIAPVVYAYQNDLHMLITAAKAQTAMTHNDPNVIQSAVFFSQLASSVLLGTAPTEAIRGIVNQGSLGEPLNHWIKKGLDSVHSDTRTMIKQFGQMCDTAAALPGVVHLISKFEGDLKQGLIENVMAGGDSAARGMLAAMIIGAHVGEAGIPHNWLTGLKLYDRIGGLMDMIRV